MPLKYQMYKIEAVRKQKKEWGVWGSPPENVENLYFKWRALGQFCPQAQALCTSLGVGGISALEWLKSELQINRTASDAQMIKLWF